MDLFREDRLHSKVSFSLTTWTGLFFLYPALYPSLFILLFLFLAIYFPECLERYIFILFSYVENFECNWKYVMMELRITLRFVFFANLTVIYVCLYSLIPCISSFSNTLWFDSNVIVKAWMISKIKNVFITLIEIKSDLFLCLKYKEIKMENVSLVINSESMKSFFKLYDDTTCIHTKTTFCY